MPSSYGTTMCTQPRQVRWNMVQNDRSGLIRITIITTSMAMDLVDAYFFSPANYVPKSVVQI